MGETDDIVELFEVVVETMIADIENARRISDEPLAEKEKIRMRTTE